ncbi:MAG: hypothetical protein ABIF04_02560 [Chloroflexota bacterium]
MKLFFRTLLRFLKRPAFLAFVYFAALTVVMTYPLAFRMGEIVGGGGGDGTYFVWLVGWYQKALFELKISPLFNPYLNYPQGWFLASTDITPAMVIPGLPGSLLFGPTWGYNFSMLLSFALSGWGMYLWIRDLTKDNLAGLVAGTIYGFIPFHMAHFVIGHLSLSGMQWFPFYFWGLYNLLKQEKFSWKPVLLASASIFLIGLTSPYYVYMTILISVVFILGFALFKGYKRLKSLAFWKSVLFFGLFATLLVGLAMIPYLRLNAQSGLATRSVEYASEYSASPTDFVIPSIKQFLWGKWIDDRFSPEIWQESTLYIGAISFVLGIIAWWKRRNLTHPELIGIAALTGLSAFVLALGIEPHWLGQKIVSLPRILQPIFHRTDMPQIYLPAYYLFRYLPFFSKMRVMMRFGLFTLVFSSMMAGLGAHLLLKVRALAIRRWATVSLLLLVFIDFFPGPITDLAPITSSPADYWLATQPDIGSVAVFPFADEVNQSQVYDTLIYQKPFLGGFFNANSPEQYTRIRPVMNAFPSSESIDMLKTLGVAYVIVDSSNYSDFLLVDQTIQSLGLQLLQICEAEYIYGFP